MNTKTEDNESLKATNKKLEKDNRETSERAEAQGEGSGRDVSELLSIVVD